MYVCMYVSMLTMNIFIYVCMYVGVPGRVLVVKRERVYLPGSLQERGYLPTYIHKCIYVVYCNIVMANA